MNLVNAIQLAGAVAGMVALAAMLFPHRDQKGAHPRRTMLLLAALLTVTHSMSALEHMGFTWLDRPVDFARLLSPILWFFLLYSWLQSDATRRLAASEERYRFMFDHNPVPMWVYDPVTLVFLDANNAAALRYGYSRAEFANMPIKVLYLPEDYPAVVRFIRTVPQHLTNSGYWRHRKRNGEVIEVAIHSDHIYYQGREARIIVAIDVTQRNETEAALHESRYFLEKAQEVAHIGSWWSDPQRSTGRLIWSRETYRICGLSEEDFDGRFETFLSLVHPDDRDRVIRASEDAFKHGSQYSIDHRLIRPDGTVIWVHEQADVIRDAQGKLTRLVGVCQDITARKQAEQKLAEQEEDLKESQRLARVGSWTWTLDTDEVIWSEGMFDIFGLPPGSPVPRFAEHDKLFTPRCWEELKTAVMRGVESGIPYTVDGEIIRADGTTGWITAKGFPECNAEGRVVKLRGVAHDISERKRFDDTLVQVARGVSSDVGDSFFRSLVQHLARAPGVDYAFVGEAMPDQPHMIRTIAVSGREALLDNFSYCMDNTPCALTFANQTYSIIEGAAAAFPQDQLLADMGVQSYVGMTLRDSANRALGIIAVMGRRAITNLQVIEPLLQIFAVRAAAELNRSIAERALLDSTQRLDLALRAAQLGVWDWHIPSGRVIYDHRWAQMLGYDHSELDPNVVTWDQLLHPDDRAHVMAVLADHLEGRTGFYETEYRIRTKSGQWKWILDQGSVVERDAQGTPVRAVGTHMDIDDRKRAAASIEEWKNRYEAAIHASQQILFDWNTTTGQVMVAGATDRLMGCQPHDLDTIEKWESFIHPDDVAAFRQQLAHVIESRSPFMMEYRMRRADGSYLEVQDHGYFFTDAHGQRMRMVGFVADISAHKEAERQRRRTEAEFSHRQRMETVGNLAAGIAHDFSNLLTAINGHLALAIRSLLPDHPARRSLQMVEKAAQQGLDMTRTITTFTHKTGSTKQPCSLCELASDSIHFFRHLLSQNIIIDLVAPDDGGPWVLAARSQFQQIMMNLLLNARDAMPGGGRIVVDVRSMPREEAWNTPLSQSGIAPLPPTTAREESGNLPPSRMAAVISVTDTGCGMDEQVMSRLYEPFFTTKERQHGTGLGLLMVHGIVNNHEGRIAVASTIGVGSRFAIMLPACEPKPAAPPAIHQHAVPAHRPRFVLLLQPHGFVGEIMVTSLESGGYAVVTARTADELVQLAGEHGGEIGAVVIDADLFPVSDDGDTPDLFALVRQLNELPVILMSANAARFLDEPAAQQLRILSKPFQMSRLIDSVDQTVGVTPTGAQ